MKILLRSNPFPVVFSEHKEILWELFKQLNLLLNYSNKSDIKNNNTSGKNILKRRENTNILKSSLNQKIIDCMEKKKIAKNILNQNKNAKYNLGDSYEFNFTFNNFNSNFTYNNLTEKDTILKNDNKNQKKNNHW